MEMFILSYIIVNTMSPRNVKAGTTSTCLINQSRIGKYVLKDARNKIARKLNKVLLTRYRYNTFGQLN